MALHPDNALVLIYHLKGYKDEFRAAVFSVVPETPWQSEAEFDGKVYRLDTPFEWGKPPTLHYLNFSNTNPDPWCPDERMVPVCLFHGTELKDRHWFIFPGQDAAYERWKRENFFSVDSRFKFFRSL